MKSSRFTLLILLIAPVAASTAVAAPITAPPGFAARSTASPGLAAPTSPSPGLAAPTSVSPGVAAATTPSPGVAAADSVKGGEGQAPMQPAELRVFALYGPREFSTFSSYQADPWAAGETASSSAPLDRQTEDRWLGFDKVQHVTFSFLWTLGTQYVAVNKGRFSEAQALPISIGTSAAVGLSKEYYDLRIGPTRIFSYKDLVADGVGILLAVGVILL